MHRRSYQQGLFDLSGLLIAISFVIITPAITVNAQSSITSPTTAPTTRPTTRETHPDAQATSAPVLPLHDGHIANKERSARAAATAPSAADPIIAKLDQAKASCNKAISDRKQALLAAIDARINIAADAGEISTVNSLRASRNSANADGSLLTNEKEPSILTAKARYDKTVQTGHLQLVAAYKQAVHDLTKVRQFERAEAVQAEFDSLPELHQSESMILIDNTPVFGTELMRMMKGSTGRTIGGSIVLEGDDRIDTDAAFRAPVIFKIKLMTSGDTRIAYAAAEQIIFNWANDENQLRIDGGPAGGKHKDGVGKLPKNQWVEITLNLLPNSLTIGVNNEDLYHIDANFSHVNQSLSLFTLPGSVVTVKSILVFKKP